MHGPSEVSLKTNGISQEPQSVSRVDVGWFGTLRSQPIRGHEGAAILGPGKIARQGQVILDLLSHVDRHSETWAIERRGSTDVRDRYPPEAGAINEAQVPSRFAGGRKSTAFGGPSKLTCLSQPLTDWS